MCTLETRGNIFLLTLTGNTEHRLSRTLISQIRSLLSQIRSESKSKPGSVLITTAEKGKFFSNGLDLAWAESDGKSHYRDRLIQMTFEFKLLIADLISLPLPTIAAVTGHAAAAGFMLAIAHDYVLMRKDRGVLYMSEIDIGLTFADYFMELMRARFGSPSNLRDLVLQGVKVKGEEGMKMGIIDSVYDSPEETVEAAMRLGDKLSLRKWHGEVYAEIRKHTLKDVSLVLGLVHKVVMAPRL
ncbi:Enoyl-coa isomerase [Thalictrum thalictroides]|uniref:Delta(3)-Delta(2)-enoyl-CoA isomerase n=1 Tax=Thalictrum thalictroides TaxID=46969 RepID=A0A7J6VP82_THATH|nr:Enoyl-coa isomerase [Thalictrum thalictroides]